MYIVLIMSITKELNEFKKKLSVKLKDNKEYYYITLSNPFVKKQIYVGRRSDDTETLINYYIKVIINEFYESLKFILDLKYEKSDILTNDQIIIINIKRFLFYFILRNFSESDIKRYEEAKYTEYVQGTTSIEGNTYTLNETDLTLNQGLTVTGKEKREFYEIDNYSTLKKHIDNKSISNITPKLILKIHEYIMRNIDDESAGIYRNIPVFISGSSIQPVQHIFIEERIEDLCNWYNKNKNKINPLELMAKFHHEFEMIHPFRDGNGRVGRELLRLQLKYFSFPSIFINKSNREQYRKGLADADNGNYCTLINYFSGLIDDELDKLNIKLIEFLKKPDKILDSVKQFDNEYVNKEFKKINNKLQSLLSDLPLTK